MPLSVSNDSGVRQDLRRTIELFRASSRKLCEGVVCEGFRKSF